jgi:hypothetical protein
VSATVLPATPPADRAEVPIDEPRSLFGTDRALLVGLYGLGVVAYFLLGLLRHGPTVVPDELTYAHLASSLAHGDGFSWGGGPIHMRAALYVYLVTPSWWLSSGYGAYTIAKLISAAAICSVVFPTYLLARTAVRGRLALIPCALVAVGTWMVAAGGILTENAAFPLAVLALYATVQAVRNPGTRWVWIALATALLATWSRYQLIVLVPAVSCALAVDVVRAGADWRARLRAHRVPLAITVALGVCWAIVFMTDPALAGGNYVGVGNYQPGFGQVASDIWEHSVALVLMVGIVPAIAWLAVAVRRANWSDPAIGPLLATSVPFAALLLLESSFFTAGFGSAWEIDRYVEYVVPLIFVVFVAGAARGLIGWRSVGLISGAVALGLWFAPSLRSVTEQRAIYGLSTHVHSIVGTGTAASIGVAGAVVILAALAIAYRYPRRAVVLLTLLTAVVLITQSEAAWQWQTRLSSRWASQFPADKAWVDHHAGGPVARLIVSANSPLAQTLEFFNRDIEQTYVPAKPATYLGNAPLSRTCEWAAPNGYLKFGAGCGPRPTRFLLDDPSARLTFYGQTVLARDQRIGTLVELRGAPRLRSALTLPCPKRYVATTQAGGPIAVQAHTACRGVLQASFWLDRAATLAVTFHGGTSVNVADIGDRRWTIQPGRDTTVRIAVPAGGHGVSLGLDWNDSAGAPAVTAARLLSPGQDEDLL